MTRIGPNWSLFVLALAGLGLIVAFFLTGTRPWVLPLAGLLVLLGTVPGWSWVRLDPEGIHRWGIAGAKHVPWAAVDTVLGRRAEGHPSITRATFGTGSTVLTQFVVDDRNRPLLRLDPWIRDRRRLVRLIVATAAGRRRADGDPSRTGA